MRRTSHSYSCAKPSLNVDLLTQYALNQRRANRTACLHIGVDTGCTSFSRVREFNFILLNHLFTEVLKLANRDLIIMQ